MASFRLNKLKSSSRLHKLLNCKYFTEALSNIWYWKLIIGKFGLRVKE